MPSTDAQTESELKPILDIERTIHSAKTAFACVAGFLLAKLVHFPVDQWLIITILVVMCGQINVGSMINKSKMRFLGTLSGSLIAGLTIAVFGANAMVVACIIVISTIFFSYIATSETSYSESGPLGAVTVVVILLGQNPSLYTAFHRFLEISTGILIAALVSQFILPIRARDHLRAMQAKAISQLHEYYDFSLVIDKDEATIQELDEAIVKSLSSQRNLAKQAAREPFGIAFDRDNFNQLLRSEKEIFRSIVCMHYANDMLPSGKQLLKNMPGIHQFHASVMAALKTISENIDKKTASKTQITIPSLQPVKDAINAARSTTQIDDLVYIDGYLFCAEIIVIQLTELAILTEQRFPTAPEQNPSHRD